MTPPHRRPHSRGLQAGSPPSRIHLCTMETHTDYTPPCCWKNSLTDANALRGPRLVSGKIGGAVTIHCHYAPSSVNRHQRKYWCRPGPPLWICYTIVSTNHYTHHDYKGRVTLTDFPQSSLFMVKLSQLSPNDTGLYRCGIGDRNDMLFFEMNLIVSAGPSNTTYAAALTSAELITASPGRAEATNRWTLGVTQTLEGGSSEGDRTTPTTANRWTPGVTQTLEGGSSEQDRTDLTTANRWTPGVTQTLEGGSSEQDRTTQTTANRWTPGVTQTLEGGGSEQDRTDLTTANRWTPGVTQTLEGGGSEQDRTDLTTANRWTPGVTQTLEGGGSEQDRTDLTTANRWTPGVTQTLEGGGSEQDRTDLTTANRWTPGVTQTLEGGGSEQDRTDLTTANRWTPGVTQTLEGGGSEQDRTDLTTANRWTPGVTQTLEGGGSEQDRTDLTTANRWTPGVTQILEGQGSERNRTDLTTRISKTIASANGRQTPRAARTMVPGTSSREEGSIKAIVPTPQSPDSKSKSMFSTTQGVLIWGTRNSATTSASTSEGEKKGTTPAADGPQEETEVSMSPEALRKTTGANRPSVLISENVTLETLQEAMEASNQRTLDSAEESSPAPNAWTENTTHMQMTSGSIDWSLENTGGESRPAAPSQLSPDGPMRTPGNESSMKSAFTEGESNSWILTPVSTVLVLVLLASLVLLKRRLRRERTSKEAERPPRITLIQVTHLLPDKLPNVGKNLHQGDLPPAQGSLFVLEDQNPEDGKVNSSVTMEGGPRPDLSKASSSPSHLHPHKD
ncbi:high affinity immunoglobulin alpha and immunoglobulin mu Fc receptor [Mesocricetus auratus]|uniref:high affinity immunoglobulin alpha and immunoglobulin mu Fc receptor n=1 Tax=Mesocricetus auratus TaxID=10036 RepID=UPI001AF02950|nr:high affinity immunoglobulin alpha and immunoglobulin mu Fc receptor [Mesocricetus auratus]